MVRSPKKKKIKMIPEPAVPVNELKRSSETEDTSRKRLKREDCSSNAGGETQQHERLAQRKKNFITSCDQVSFKSYSDPRSRFLLLNVPQCMTDDSGKHSDHKNEPPVSATPGFVEGSFNVDLNKNMWYEALEVCQISLTKEQYLSTHMLKNIVEIMLNTHSDDYADYTTMEIINKCQEILSSNFLMHPPCHDDSLRNCYRNFLTEPMDLRDKSFTNRAEFQCDRGIVKYCMNRLEYELSSQSKDGPLLDRSANTPENMNLNISWQKEKFEIFEMLPRKERIDRLMMVLASIIELLQLDLAIWHARHPSRQDTNILTNRPLIAYTLWAKLIIGTVNRNCRQVLKLFVQFVSLGYPAKYINIMKTWFNTIVQTIYICGENPDTDYPHIQHHSLSFAEKFHELIKEYPNESIYSILQAIYPSFMRYLIGFIHFKTHTPKYIKEDGDILSIFKDFLKKSSWEKVPDSDIVFNTEILDNNKPRRERRFRWLLRYLSRKCSPDDLHAPVEYRVYPKIQKDPTYFVDDKDNKVHLLSILYITLTAYIDGFNIQRINEMWDSLNEKTVSSNTEAVATSNHDNRYTVSAEFLKKYKSILQMVREIKIDYDKYVQEDTFLDKLKIFENISYLKLNT